MMNYRHIFPLCLLAILFSTTGQPVDNDSHNSRNTSMILLKVPLEKLRLPRQQDLNVTSAPVTASTVNNQNTTSTSTQAPPQDIPPGTAENVANILGGLLTEDVRPILSGSTAFIPPGNLREGVEALLQGIAPVIQNILFGPGPYTHFQTHYSLPHYSQSQEIQTVSTTVNPVTYTKTYTPNVEVESTPSILSEAVVHEAHLKGETEGPTKQKEYIYLVLKPAEYEELVKFSTSSDNRTLSFLKVQEETNSITSTPKLPSVQGHQEVEDDEYEAFLLNNVTDLHLRDFYVNLTRV